MKKLLCILFAVGILLCGCTKAPAETQPTEGALELPTSGVGQAVTPEEGDIVIEINP